MGFGTGHHATTRLCLAALQQLEVKERTVIDVGTGSGVLAIAASLLGAVDVRGIDDDEDAIHAAWDNLALNPVGASSPCSSATCARPQLEPADIVFGNLTGGLLMASAGDCGTLTGAHGTADSERLPGATRSATSWRRSPAFAVERREQEDDWVCVTLKRNRS